MLEVNLKGNRHIIFADSLFISILAQIRYEESVAGESGRARKYSFVDEGEIEQRVMVDHGLGFGMTPFRNRRAGHTGGATGFAGTMTRLVDDNLTVIVLTSADRENF